MKDEINNDNLYKEGTVICAKVDPTLKLIITNYRKRIYYCAVEGHPDEKNFAYFENELIPPVDGDQHKHFVPIDSSATNKNYVERAKLTF